MREFYVEFDMMNSGYQSAYYYCKNESECMNAIAEEFVTWNDCGHANVYEDGEFLFDFEV